MYRPLHSGSFPFEIDTSKERHVQPPAALLFTFTTTVLLLLVVVDSPMPPSSTTVATRDRHRWWKICNIVRWVMEFLTIAHYVFLEHYYSVDFPWWFDRQKNASVEFRQHAQIFKLIWRSNPWMDPLEKNILLHYFLLYFMQVLSFSPWMACFNLNVTDLNFFHKSKAKLVKFVAN